LAPEAVEFDCTPAEEAALLNGFVSRRRLRIGQQLMLYVNDAAGLIEHVRRYDRGDRRPISVRLTNLEDVYLLLTGVSLESNP
jgi:hypothetical protein